MTETSSSSSFWVLHTCQYVLSQSNSKAAKGPTNRKFLKFEVEKVFPYPVWVRMTSWPVHPTLLFAWRFSRWFWQYRLEVATMQMAIISQRTSIDGPARDLGSGQNHGLKSLPMLEISYLPIFCMWTFSGQPSKDTQPSLLLFHLGQ